jgi:hypothetical protein
VEEKKKEEYLVILQRPDGTLMQEWHSFEGLTEDSIWKFQAEVSKHYGIQYTIVNLIKLNN